MILFCCIIFCDRNWGLMPRFASKIVSRLSYVVCVFVAGFNVETAKHKDFAFTVWDTSLQEVRFAAIQRALIRYENVVLETAYRFGRRGSDSQSSTKTSSASYLWSIVMTQLAFMLVCVCVCVCVCVVCVYVCVA